MGVEGVGGTSGQSGAVAPGSLSTGNIVAGSAVSVVLNAYLSPYIFGYVGGSGLVGTASTLYGLICT